MGTRHDQDVRAPTVRRAGHAQRPRVRRLSGRTRRDRLLQGRQLFYRGRRTPNDLARVADTLSQPATVGRLRAVCNRWIYTACLCFGLDSDELLRSGFGYAYSVYQVEYSRNLLFADGARWTETVRHRGRPHPFPAERDQSCGPCSGRNNAPADRPVEPSSDWRPMIETPVYDLTNFKVHFGRLTLKALHQRRTRAAVRGDRAQHQGTELPPRDRQCSVRSSPDWPAWPSGSAPRWTASTSASFPTTRSMNSRSRRRSDATRVGGIDLNRPRMRSALAAVLALAPAPNGFTVTEFAEQVRALDPDSGYSTRHASYDLRKIRGKHLVERQGRTRRYHSTTRSRPHHRRPAHPSGTGHRTHHRRCPQPRTRPQTQGPGPRSTATTKPCASTCKPSSHTSASTTSTPQRHRQHFVDRIPASG